MDKRSVMSSKEHAARGITIEMRRHLEHEIEHLSHVLPGQGPIETFIHHNTLHGFQHLPFEEALTEATKVLGGRGHLKLEEYRRFFGAGRITKEDLDQALKERRIDLGKEVLARAGERKIRARDIGWIAIRFGVEPLFPGETPEQRLGKEGMSKVLPEVPQKTRARLLEASKKELEAAIAKIGKKATLAEVVGEIFGIDIATSVLDAALLVATDDGLSDENAVERAFDDVGIPAALRADYLGLIEKKLAKSAAAGKPALWLEAESEHVRRVMLAYFGVEETLPEFTLRVRNQTEEVTVLSLLCTSLSSFGASDAFLPLNSQLLTAEEPEGARIEALFEKIEHLEAWGGPAIPLDRELSTNIRAAVQHHLDRAHDKHEHGHIATTEIARLCLTVVHDLGVDHLRRRGFEALRALESIDDEPEESEPLLIALAARDPRRQMMEHARKRLDWHFGRIGHETCHRDLLLALTGEDIHEKIHPQIMRITMAFLDEGLAAWHVAGRALGFYDAFRKMAEHDQWFDLEGLTGARDALRELPPLAADAIIQNLMKLGIPQEHWGHYLRRLAVALPGVGGMVYWRETHPSYQAQKAHPIDLIQFLAVRLFYETLYVRRAARHTFGHDGSLQDFRHYFETHLPELLVRHALFSGSLPDFLAERARALLSAPTDGAGAFEESMMRLADMVFYYKQSAEIVGGGHTARRSAFRLFVLAQHLGLTPGEVRAIPLAEKEAMLGKLDAMPPEVVTPIWHDAYELHYRDSILHALAKNLREPAQIERPERPEAQLIFCMDDREEAIRRHVEEMNPGYETLGVAGFFGVAIDFLGLGAKEANALCPIVATPGHRLAECPRPESVPDWVALDRRMRVRATIRDVVREALRNPVSSYFLIDIIGLLSLLPVIGRVLFPRAYERMAKRAMDAVMPAVATEIPTDREGEPHVDPPRKIAFSVQEQADRVTATLRNMGFVKNFAPLVVLLGHGSQSRNNPHLSAYDCGACGGNHGGPNARVFARMANRKDVRDILRTRGIDIPDDTWFLGSEHNTATDIVHWFDLEDAPKNKRKAIERLQADMERASAMSAHERCRKFESAPVKPSQKRAFHHVIGRTSDLSQARPELGHVTNAFCIIGPRTISQDVFLDRRSFLISYDAKIDPEGKIVEGILLAAGPVGAGISLEYYFSTVDNAVYGCGTKVPHNVAGLIGVLEGASSDLRTGLPKQMIEIHEPMRLVLLVAAKPEILGQIYGRQEIIRELVGNAWVRLVAMDPDTNQFHVFIPGQGFIPWEDRGGEIPVVKRSVDWYANHIDFLDPVLIRPDESATKPPAKAKDKPLKKTKRSAEQVDHA